MKDKIVQWIYFRKFNKYTSAVYIEKDQKLIWANKIAKNTYGFTKGLSTKSIITELSEAFDVLSLDDGRNDIKVYIEKSIDSVEKVLATPSTTTKTSHEDTSKEELMNFKNISNANADFDLVLNKLDYLFKSSNITLFVRHEKSKFRLKNEQRNIIEECMRILHFIQKDKNHSHIDIITKTINDNLLFEFQLQDVNAEDIPFDAEYSVRGIGTQTISYHLNRLELLLAKYEGRMSYFTTLEGAFVVSLSMMDAFFEVTTFNTSQINSNATGLMLDN